MHFGYLRDTHDPVFRVRGGAMNDYISCFCVSCSPLGFEFGLRRWREAKAWSVYRVHSDRFLGSVAALFVGDFQTSNACALVILWFGSLVVMVVRYGCSYVLELPFL